MKKIILFSISIFLFSTLQAEAGGKPNGCSTYVNCPDVKDGPENCTHPNDKNNIIIKANRKNGKLEGDYWCARESGEPHVKVKFNNDEYDGLYEEYDPSLKEWGTKTYYKNGKREGLDTRRISEGRKIIRFYKDDQAYGFEIIVNSSNKILSISNCEEKNMRKKDEDCEKIYIPGYESQQKAYFEAKAAEKKADDNKTVEKKFKNGKIAVRYKVVDGQIEGDHEEFFENGQLANLRKYKAGKVQEEKDYFDDGQMKAHILFDGRFPTQETLFYQNGKMKSEKKMSKEDKWNTKVIFKEYYDNGKLAAEGVRIRYPGGWGEGSPEGEIKGYSESGEPLYVENYKNGKRDGKQVSYGQQVIYNTVYANGVLTEETILDAETKKQKSHKTFFPDGSVKSENKN
jgi:antitoxin component YwqK of YwqJK toxin-antitoxin module